MSNNSYGADPHGYGSPQQPQNGAPGPNYSNQPPQGAPSYGPQNPYAQHHGQGQAPYGHQQQGYQQQPPYGQAPMGPRKSKMAAGLFGIILGGLGIHNFYLGNTTKGLIQLGLTVVSFGFLALVSSVWGLIEGIMILTARPGSEWSVDAKGIPLE